MNELSKKMMEQCASSFSRKVYESFCHLDRQSVIDNEALVDAAVNMNVDEVMEFMFIRDADVVQVICQGNETEMSVKENRVFVGASFYLTDGSQAFAAFGFSDSPGSFSLLMTDGDKLNADEISYFLSEAITAHHEVDEGFRERFDGIASAAFLREFLSATSH